MGRPRLHDWPELLEEYRQGQWATVAAFAAEKGLHPVQVTREFRSLGFNARQQNAKSAKKRNGTKRTGGKKSGGNGRMPAARPAPPDTTPKHPICGARAKSKAGEPCRRPAGWGTDHLGTGRCKFHGGRSPGVPGNQNALRHGAYADLILEQLTPQERAVFAAIPADDSLQEELRIVRFKLLRLLQPMERQVAVGGPGGAEIVTLNVDEITRARGIALLVDSARKILKDLRESGQEDDGSLTALLEAIERSRKADTEHGGV